MAFKVNDLLVHVLPEHEAAKCKQGTCMFASNCNHTKCNGKTCLGGTLCEKTKCVCTFTQGTGCGPASGAQCESASASALDLEALRGELRSRRRTPVGT
jgi:hypothetical protein